MTSKMLMDPIGASGFLSDVSRKAQADVFAALARIDLQEVDDSNRRIAGRALDIRVTADGRAVGPIANLRAAQSEVVAEWDAPAMVYAWIWRALNERSPSVSGNYRGSHQMLADGAVCAPDQVPAGAKEIVFINMAEYARRLEVGHTESGRPFLIQVPNRIYERTAEDAHEMFPGVSIAFRFISWSNAYATISGRSKGSLKQSRSRRGDASHPAIIITLATCDGNSEAPMAASTQEVVRRMRIEYQTVGADEAARKFGEVGKSQDLVAVSSARATTATGAYEQALAQQMRVLSAVEAQYKRMGQIQSELTNAQVENSRVMQVQFQAANENSASFNLLSVESIELTQHLKTAAVAAYALSPAVRSVMNPAIAAATTTAVKALGPAAVTAGAVALRALSPLLAFVTRLAVPVYAVVGAFTAMNAITELGAEKLRELNSLSQDAASAGVGADYFQRQAKGAEDLGLKIDLATQALKRFGDASQSKLGGSGFENHLDALTKAGNFDGNAGVAAYKQAATIEEKYRAAGEIITIAIEKGERLAGLDLASKFLPPEMLERLRANGELLRDLQRAADEVKPVDLFTQEQIGYAAELNRRLETANKTIENGLKPIQRDLTMLGLNYQETWVSITEYMATGVKLANDFYSALKKIPDMFADMGSWSIWGKISSLTEKLGLNSRPEGLVKKGEPGFGADLSAGSAKKVELTGWLQDANAVQTAMNNANEISGKVFKDLSKPITSGAAKAATEAKDALDRAMESVEKYIQTTEAAARSVGLGVAEQQKAKTIAELTAAALRSGVTDVSQYAAEWEKLGDRAGKAAKDLALARAQSSADFASQTIFMSAGEQNIAATMKNIYGPEWQSHMDDALAKQMRMNDLLHQSKETAQQFAGDLMGGLMSGKNLMDSLANAADNLSKKMANKALESLFSGDFVSAGIQASIALVAGAFSADQKAKKKLEEAQKVWKEAGPAFEKFVTEMSGGVQGSLAASIQSARQTMTDLATKAWDAKDLVGLRKIQDSYVQYTLAQANKVQAMFAATVQGLADGLGPDSPFFRAVEGVKSQLATVQGIIDHARTSNTTEHMTTTVDVNSAISAAQTYLLSLLRTAPAMSEVETGMLNVEGTAKALQGALVQIGMSAMDAATAIDKGLGSAINDIRVKFIGGLVASINDLSGVGYLNDIGDAQNLYQTRVADLQRLGMDSGLALTELNLKLAEIASGANLTDDQLSQLAKVFPLLADSITGLVGKSGALSVATAQSSVDQAKSDLRSAYDKEASALKTLISNHEGYIKSIQKFRDSLRLDNSLSPLDPYQRLQAAQQQFQSTTQLAFEGNDDALGRVEEVSRKYLEEARAYYGTSEAYFSIFNQVEALLDQTLATAGVQLTEAQQQLAALDTQVGLLIDINTSVMSVVDAVAALAAAQGQLATATAAQSAAQAAAYQQTGAGQVGKLYQDILGRAPDAPGAAYWQSAIAGGLGGSDLLKTFLQAAQQTGGSDASAAAAYKQLHGMLNGGIVGASEGGGIVGNGMFNVDSVIARYAGGGNIALAGGEGVINAPATQSIGAGTVDYINRTRQLPRFEAARPQSSNNDNSALIAELRAAREQDARLIEKLIGVTAAGAQANVEATKETSGEVRRTAEQSRRSEFRRTA